MIHAFCVCQTARIIAITSSDDPCKETKVDAMDRTGSGSANNEGDCSNSISNSGPRLSTNVSEGIKCGDTAICTFKFLYRSEFLEVGTVFILREGRTRGVGKVLSLG